VNGRVRSEVGPLRTVLVHRPDLELQRLTPENMEELLFDELLWVERAQEEHDAFVAVLESSGAEVLHLAELLAEVLSDGAVAEQVVKDQVNERSCGPVLVEHVRRYLLDLPVEDLVRHLIGGVSLEEADGEEGLVAAAWRPHEILLDPLPNTVFTRDSSFWIGEGVVVSPMNRLVRRREAALLRLVYRHHPRFHAAPIWFGDEPVEHYPATLEGGDVLVVSDDGLAVGVSERTSPQGLEALAVRLFDAEVVRRMAVVELPIARTTMHLDTVVTMADRDAFVFYPRLRREIRTLRMTPVGEGRIRVDEGEGLVEDLAWAAGLDHARVIEPSLHSVAADREQWNDANNVFALGPGEVVAYERNVATNEILEEAGITVHRIPSGELPRGRGGPRCMTCPIARDPL
jgi:arginine deiminase